MLNYYSIYPYAFCWLYYYTSSAWMFLAAFSFSNCSSAYFLCCLICDTSLNFLYSRTISAMTVALSFSGRLSLCILGIYANQAMISIGTTFSRYFSIKSTISSSFVSIFWAILFLTFISLSAYCYFLPQPSSFGIQFLIPLKSVMQFWRLQINFMSILYFWTFSSNRRHFDKIVSSCSSFSTPMPVY